MSPTTSAPSDATPATDPASTVTAGHPTPPRTVQVGTHVALQLLRRPAS